MVKWELVGATKRGVLELWCRLDRALLYLVFINDNLFNHPRPKRRLYSGLLDRRFLCSPFLVCGTNLDLMAAQ